MIKLYSEHTNEKYPGCVNCAISNMCDLVANQDFRAPVKMHRRSYVVERKQMLVENGDRGGSIYALCSGSLKSINHSGEDSRVIDVHLPGDILGLEAYTDTQSRYDIVSNERSTISEFILPDFRDIESSNFLKEIISLCSEQFERSRSKFEALGGKRSTLELVSSFIYSLAKRYHTKTMLVAEFRLPLTRGEIAEYLGLASETISRQFVLLEKMKIIKTKGQRLSILDFTGLQDVARIKREGDAV